MTTTRCATVSSCKGKSGRSAEIDERRGGKCNAKRCERPVVLRDHQFRAGRSGRCVEASVRTEIARVVDRRPQIVQAAEAPVIITICGRIASNASGQTDATWPPT